MSTNLIFFQRLGALLGVGSLLFAAQDLLAGVVETEEGRFEGVISFQSNSVKVGAKQVALADVLYLFADPSPASPAESAPRQLVHLSNGEVLAGEIVTGTEKQTEVRCKWFGLKQFTSDQISVLEFLPGESRVNDPKAGTLYRKAGQPIPGSLVWIDPGTVGIDSPLGTAKIPRSGLVSYVYDNKPPVVPVGDVLPFEVVGLTDGNIFRGRLSIENDTVNLEHPVVGAMTFPAVAVSFIVCYNTSMYELSALPYEITERGAGALGSGELSPVRSSPNAGFIRATRIEPNIQVRYTQPERTGKMLLLRATVTPVERARGDTRLTISVGNQKVFEKTISATDEALSVEASIPEGKNFMIDVAFDTLLRFPCGAVLQDAHLLVVN